MLGENIMSIQEGIIVNLSIFILVIAFIYVLITVVISLTSRTPKRLKEMQQRIKEKESSMPKSTLQSVDASAETIDTQSNINCKECGSSDIERKRHYSVGLYVICCLSVGIIFSVIFQMKTWGGFLGMVVGGIAAAVIEESKRKKKYTCFCKSCGHSWTEKI